MLGAIIGDIVGSPYETGSDKTKDFTFLCEGCMPTDDSLMTIAVGCACVESDINDKEDFKRAVVSYMRRIGRLYPDAGYGGAFFRWLMSDDEGPYYSYGNGSAMRVSAVAWAAGSLSEAERLAEWSAEVTHDHPEGIKGARAVAAAIYLARTGSDKSEIKEYIEKNYYSLSFTLDQIRDEYDFDVTCQGSVPQAIVCFLEGEDYCDAVRCAVSLGGDADTQACIAGSIAEAYYGIPDEIKEAVFDYLDDIQTDYYLAYADILYK